MCLHQKKSAGIILSCVPKLSRNDCEAHGSEILYQSKTEKKPKPNFKSIFNFS